MERGDQPTPPKSVYSSQLAIAAIMCRPFGGEIASGVAACGKPLAAAA